MMKKICLLILTTIISPFVTLASDNGDENYHPFVVEGKKWICQETDGKDWPLTYFDTVYTIMGDTIINGELCKKLHVENVFSNYSWYRNCHALIEQDRKVYLIKEGNTQKLLLYDFNLEEAGDGFDCDIYYVQHVTVEAVNNVSLHSEQYKQLEIIARKVFNGKEYEYKDFWIEGIGGMTDPLHRYLGSSNYFFLKTCYENGECIFDRDEYLAANTDGITSIVSAAPAANAPIYDLQGRQLNGKPEKGIYIQNGKKINK